MISNIRELEKLLNPAPEVVYQLLNPAPHEVLALSVGKYDAYFNRTTQRVTFGCKEMSFGVFCKLLKCKRILDRFGVLNEHGRYRNVLGNPIMVFMREGARPFIEVDIMFKHAWAPVRFVMLRAYGNTPGATVKSFGRSRFMEYGTIISVNDLHTDQERKDICRDFAVFCEHPKLPLYNPTGSVHEDVLDLIANGWTLISQEADKTFELVKYFNGTEERRCTINR